MAKYTANGAVQHDGRDYAHGAVLDFEPTARMLELGAVVLVAEPEPEKAEAKQFPKAKGAK